jgi:hypothetical protein
MHEAVKELPPDIVLLQAIPAIAHNLERICALYTRKNLKENDFRALLHLN